MKYPAASRAASRTITARILEVHSASTGILFDTAAVTQKASAYLARRGLSERVEIIAGDFLPPYQGATFLYSRPYCMIGTMSEPP
jgi:hypothetical protein